MNGLRLDQCGDLLTIQEYAAWARQSVKSVYNALHRGGLLVQPFCLKPKPMWKRADLEAKLAQDDTFVRQRSERARRRLRIARRA